MNKKTNDVLVPKNFTVTALLSSSLTLTLSIAYTVISIFALIYRHKCSTGDPEDASGSSFLLNTLYRVYIQHEDCEKSIQWDELTGKHSVFVLVIITLAASLVCMAASIALMTVVTAEQGSKHIHLVVYTYVGVFFASLVVDVTFAAHFGIDYGLLSDQMDMSSIGLPLNYLRDIVRLGAFLLMTITLKGFVVHVINTALVILMLIYVVEYQQNILREGHSIHKQGALRAYEQQRRHDEAWQHQPDMFLALPRGSQTNPAFMNDEDTLPRSQMREPTTMDYSNRFYDRSESWQPGPTSASSRPFSYLEEAKRTAPPPARLPSSPAAEPPWRAPPVPAPDYSPQPARRLKSALKPAYM